MKRFVVGVVVASLALFFWGFLYWGFGPYRTMVWKQAVDDGAAGQSLLEQFPETGTYYVPAFTHEPDTVEELFLKGPIAFVHMLSTTGRPSFDPSIMVQGFVLNLVVVILIGLMLRRVASALPTYLDRVKFVALMGLTAAVLIDGGDAVWWQISWSWKLYQAFYDVSAWTLTGCVLAKFIEAKGISSSEAADRN